MALHDIINGVRLWRLWGRLGWNDVLQRYRRSLLGPLWLTTSMAVMVVSLGIVYAQIFKTDIQKFMPYLCVGLLIWGYVSSLIAEAGGLFTGSESYIKQIRLPYTVYVFRFVWSRVIIFAHNALIYVGVLLYFDLWPGAALFWAVPGFLLLTLNGILASIFIGVTSTRFRDIPQIITSVVQIFFFITPIMWKLDQLGENTYLMDFNPFFHLIEIVRAPMLGQVPSIENYFAMAIITAINASVAGIFFVRFRARIAYWV